MKIYFSGSISGGRELLAVYQTIVSELKKYGTVLTEHIADSSLTIGGEKNGSNQTIFNRDLKWLKQSDLIIADVTTPSLGVGYEIAMGIERKIPVHALFYKKDNRRLSAMISGNPGVILHEYDNPDHVPDLIQQIMSGGNLDRYNP